MDRPKQILTTVCLLLTDAMLCLGASNVETKTFVAYSMKIAQERLQAALKSGEDFRVKQPDLFYLAGMTKPWAVVIDTNANDWILLGERDAKSSVLTLDDWVVALRARFVYADKDPGVSIDPRPCDVCLSVGKKGFCDHSSKQDVRFFAGIQNTHFGKVCYDADWLMKKVGFGLEGLPITNLATFYDLALAQFRLGRAAKWDVSSRFWFYTIAGRVNVVNDIVLLEKFQMGVFTEVLRAAIDDKPVADIQTFEHYPSEGFSRSFTEHFDSIAECKEAIETLRGLTRLAGLAKGLVWVADRSKLGFYLTVYPVEPVTTTQEVAVLTRENQEAGFKVSGGVSLAAFATRLKGGDAAALRELVMMAQRQSGANALSWRFVISMRDGAMNGVSLQSQQTDREDAISLLTQAGFLVEKKRYAAAVSLYESIIPALPEADLRAQAYYGLGVAHHEKGEFALAIAQHTKALECTPSFELPYYGRALAKADSKDYDGAVTDYTRAIALNPRLAPAYFNRGVLRFYAGEITLARADFNQAIDLAPNEPKYYQGRGALWLKLGKYEDAVTDLQRAAAGADGETESDLAIALYMAGKYKEATLHMDKAVRYGATRNRRLLEDYRKILHDWGF